MESIWKRRVKKMDNRKTIEEYDDNISRLRSLINQYPYFENYYSSSYRLDVDYISMKLLTNLIRREVERLTAERNNLIRGFR
jgi:hypothetical protein